MAVRLRSSWRKGKIRRQQATANRRNFRSVALPRNSGNILFGSVQPSHSCSVMSSCAFPSRSTARHTDHAALDLLFWPILLSLRQRNGGSELVGPLRTDEQPLAVDEL